MKILVNRIKSNDDATVSTISIDGDFECFGLEDQFNEIKVPKETRVPAGIYDIELRTIGGFHGRYASKFPDFHKGMLQIMDVPNFDYILIHIGNTSDNTEGCLLVGCGANTLGGISIQSSKIAYTRLYKKVIKAAMGGQLVIEFIDND